jgi:hypothetical protein
MNNWNTDYRYRNTTPYKEEPLWPVVLVMLGLVLGPILIYQGYRLFNWLTATYEWSQIVACTVLGGFTFLVTSTIVWSIASAVLRWWDGLWGGWGTTPTYPVNNTYNTGNNTNKTTIIPAKPVKSYFGRFGAKTDGLLDTERRKPPRAEFFGRLDGQPVSMQGEYVERYLNQWEYGYWLKQKERDDARKAQLLDEKIENPLPHVQTATKISY